MHWNRFTAPETHFRFCNTDFIPSLQNKIRPAWFVLKCEPSYIRHTMKRNLLLLLGALVLAAVLYYFSDIISYLLIAGVLSMLATPLMAFFQERVRFRSRHLGPSGAALMTIACFYLIIVGLLLIFVPTIVSQAKHLAAVDYKLLGERLKGPFLNLDAQLHNIGFLEPSESLGTRMQESLSQWFKPTMLGDFLSASLATVGNVAVTFASVTFILFFFLQDKRVVTNVLHAVLPREMEEKVLHALTETSRLLSRYFTGLALQTASFMALASLALWIMGVPNALLIGVMGGLFNIVPYVGPIMGIIVGCFFTLSAYIEAEFSLLGVQMLKVAAAFMGVQVIDNNLVGPYITSNSVKAHPLEIFIVTLVAAKIGGVIGMVIGVPVYTVLRVVARVFFSEFKLVQRWTEQLEEEIEAVPELTEKVKRPRVKK